jgi:hypothetical protein
MNTAEAIANDEYIISRMREIFPHINIDEREIDKMREWLDFIRVKSIFEKIDILLNGTQGYTSDLEILYLFMRNKHRDLYQCAPLPNLASEIARQLPFEKGDKAFHLAAIIQEWYQFKYDSITPKPIEQ